jgi:hypothetical protein
VCEVGREDGCEEDEEKGEEVSSKHIILEMGLKKNIENFSISSPLYPHLPHNFLYVNIIIIIIIKFYIKCQWWWPR